MKNEAYSLSISVKSLPRTLLICSVHGNGSSSFSSVTSLPFFSIQGLKPKACNFTCLKLYSKKKRPLVIINQAAAAASVVTTSPGVRFRLDNLGPQPGSRKKGKRYLCRTRKQLWFWHERSEISAWSWCSKRV
ncbi:hypothetical protein Peur_018120 [Populus x canadensis]